jgi:hypothetical protein
MSLRNRLAKLERGPAGRCALCRDRPDEVTLRIVEHIVEGSGVAHPPPAPEPASEGAACPRCGWTPRLVGIEVVQAAHLKERERGPAGRCALCRDRPDEVTLRIVEHIVEVGGAALPPPASEPASERDPCPRCGWTPRVVGIEFVAVAPTGDCAAAAGDAWSGWNATSRRPS